MNRKEERLKLSNSDTGDTATIRGLLSIVAAADKLPVERCHLSAGKLAKKKMKEVLL